MTISSLLPRAHRAAKILAGWGGSGGELGAYFSCGRIKNMSGEEPSMKALPSPHRGHALPTALAARPARSAPTAGAGHAPQDGVR